MCEESVWSFFHRDQSETLAFNSSPQLLLRWRWCVIKHGGLCLTFVSICLFFFTVVPMAHAAKGEEVTVEMCDGFLPSGEATRRANTQSVRTIWPFPSFNDDSSDAGEGMWHGNSQPVQTAWPLPPFGLDSSDDRKINTPMFSSNGIWTTTTVLEGDGEPQIRKSVSASSSDGHKIVTMTMDDDGDWKVSEDLVPMDTADSNESGQAGAEVKKTVGPWTFVSGGSGSGGWKTFSEFFDVFHGVSRRF